MTRNRKQDMFQSVVISLVAGAILFCGWGFAGVRKAEKAYTPTNLSRVLTDLEPSETVRLHVIGNSDSQEDQDAKLLVRDALMESLGPCLLEAKDPGKARSLIAGCLPDIEEVATRCLKESGKTYRAKAVLTTVSFPDRTYRTGAGQEVFLPQGPYTALQVVLGTGAGQNWWCVMYPPLCYFDLVQKAVALGDDPGRAVPTTALADDPGLILVDESQTEEVPVRVRFLLLDAVKAGFHKLVSLFNPGLASFCQRQKLQ